MIHVPHFGRHSFHSIILNQLKPAMRFADAHLVCRAAMGRCRFSNMISEGRQSIRESLRIFSVIESHLKVSPTSCFETMCRDIAADSRRGDRCMSMSFDVEHSCGNTMRCFASLFLSHHQINRSFVEHLINGSDLYTFMSNPNVLIHMNIALWSNLYSRVSPIHTSSEDESFALASKICRYVSKNRYERLEKELFRGDVPETLPRVLFCSVVWANPHAGGGPEPLAGLQDHKFTIIKHTNDHFQIVQGYISDALQNQPDGDAAAAVRSPPPFRGFSLGSWQGSSSEYCSLHGFDRQRMVQFMAHMLDFTSADRFEPKGYKSMFGVDLRSKAGNDGPSRLHCYWPSLQFNELSDEVIIGFGTRDMAHAIESHMSRN